MALRLAIVPVFAVLVFAAGTASRAAAPVEGDAELLQSLFAAQRANAASLARGRVRATATVRESSSGQEMERAEATVLWDGPNTYWDYSREYPGLKVDGKPTQREDRGVAIETPETFILYHSESSRVFVNPSKTGSYHQILRLRPDQIWLVHGRHIDLNPISWAELLDPESTRSATLPHKYVVRREGEIATVELHYEGREVFTVNAALAHGGHIVSYDTETVVAKRLIWKTGKYEWERHPSGVYWLRRYEMTYSDPKGSPYGKYHYLLEVSDFDPDPDIPKNRFELESLDLPDGTRVTEDRGKGQRRQYRIGGEGIFENDLDRLADEARRARFASPDR